MAKKKNGRPRKEINWKQLYSLCEIQCTQEEIASVLDICVDTIDTRCKEEHELSFSEIYKKHAEKGKKSLRRAQFSKAIEGNTTMLVWLGKQYLGQRDKTELSGPDGGPIQHAHDLPDDVLAKIITEGEKKGARK